MAQHTNSPPEDLPEADAVEQRTPVADADETDDLTAGLDPVGRGPLGLGQADEADLLEQSLFVADDEDHPHGPAGLESP